MSIPIYEFVFWMGIVSPHMVGLAKALAFQGNKVTYVAGELISLDRARLGWVLPDMDGLVLKVVKSIDDAISLAQGFSNQTIHLAGGLRGNGYISAIIQILSQRHARWGVIMETIDERFGRAPIKRFVYKQKFCNISTCPDFVLAIGALMSSWIADRGFPKERIFSFAYFLPPHPAQSLLQNRNNRAFQICFIGRLVPVKRLDLLIDALSGLSSITYELSIVGMGPLENKLTRMAEKKLGIERVRMYGQIPMVEVRRLLASFDCLVLPSDVDGWGAVVSEALMAGTQAICSDGCGSAVAVQASGVGGIFPRGDLLALRKLLSKCFDAGRISIEKRQNISDWAKCLGSEAGAKYLNTVINSVYGNQTRPQTPWSTF